MKLQVYTDGACSGNPGVGGWAYVVMFDDEIAYTSSDIDLNTTNNRMELLAVVEALNKIELEHSKFKRVDIYSDSAYVINCIKNGYLKRWSKNKWRNGKGNEVSHKDLWVRILKFIENKSNVKVNFVKVKGHSGVHGNELADKAARSKVDFYKKYGVVPTDASSFINETI